MQPPTAKQGSANATGNKRRTVLILTVLCRFTSPFWVSCAKNPLLQANPDKSLTKWSRLPGAIFWK